MSDVDVDLSAELFAPSAYVRIFPVGPVAGEMAARAAVAADGTLQIEGLEDGDYWAVLDGQEPIAVRAQDGKITRRDEDAAAVVPDPNAGLRSRIQTGGRDVVTGARTSVNARVKNAADAVKKAVRR